MDFWNHLLKPPIVFLVSLWLCFRFFPAPPLRQRPGPQVGVAAQFVAGPLHPPGWRRGQPLRRGGGRCLRPSPRSGTKIGWKRKEWDVTGAGFGWRVWGFGLVDSWQLFFSGFVHIFNFPTYGWLTNIDSPSLHSRSLLRCGLTVKLYGFSTGFTSNKHINSLLSQIWSHITQTNTSNTSNTFKHIRRNMLSNTIVL